MMKSNLSKKIKRIEEIDKFEREATKTNIEFARLPIWRQAQLTDSADYKQSNFDMEQDEA